MRGLGSEKRGANYLLDHRLIFTEAYTRQLTN